MSGAGFRDEEDPQLYMERCYSCGKKNWAPAIASGICAWCGYEMKESDLIVNLVNTDRIRQKVIEAYQTTPEQDAISEERMKKYMVTIFSDKDPAKRGVPLP